MPSSLFLTQTSAFISKLRVFLFLSFLLIITTLPLYILFNNEGAIIGLSFFLIIFLKLRLWGCSKLLRKLKATPLSKTTHPVLFHLVQEQSQKVGLRFIPELWECPSHNLNIACVGFTPKESHLIFTEKSILSLSREEILELLILGINALKNEQMLCWSWFSQFSLQIEKLSPSKKQVQSLSRSLISNLVPLLLFPLSFLPFLLLRYQNHLAPPNPISNNLKQSHFLLKKLLLSRNKDAIGFRDSLLPLFLIPPKVNKPLFSFLLSQESDSWMSFTQKLWLAKLY